MHDMRAALIAGMCAAVVPVLAFNVPPVSVHMRHTVPFLCRQRGGIHALKGGTAVVL